MSFVCLFNLLDQSMSITTVQDANSIRGMSRCTRYTCTWKTSIVDFGKEKEHCSRYKSQNVWFLLKYPHMYSSPPRPIAFIIEQAIDHKSLTNVCHIKCVSSTPRHSSNRVSILNCCYRHWLIKYPQNRRTLNWKSLVLLDRLIFCSS
jgi:hypothetical protein